MRLYVIIILLNNNNINICITLKNTFPITPKQLLYYTRHIRNCINILFRSVRKLKYLIGKLGALSDKIKIIEYIRNVIHKTILINLNDSDKAAFVIICIIYYHFYK